MRPICRTFKGLIASLCLSTVLLYAPASRALLINDTGDDFTVIWSQAVTSDSGTQTLSATGVFDITLFSNSEIDIAVLFTNTTLLSVFADASVASLGFYTAPGPTGILFVVSGSYFNGASLTSIPSAPAFNLCIFTANNCAGGAMGDLLPAGQSDYFTIKLLGDFSNGLLLPEPGNFGLYFQSGFTIFGSEISSDNISINAAPVPATPLLLGLGLIALAWRRRAG